MCFILSEIIFEVQRKMNNVRGALPEAVEIIFEVQRKMNNEKITSWWPSDLPSFNWL
jgi:hypothetical protein